MLSDTAVLKVVEFIKILLSLHEMQEARCIEH